MKKIFLLAIILMLGFGCASLKSSNVCGDIPQGETSLICAVAGKLGTTPENVSKVLKVGNAALIMKDKVSADEVLTFIEKAKDVLWLNSDKVISVDVVMAYVHREYGLLSKEAMALLTVIDPFADVELEIPGILSDYDIYLLLLHLDEQARLVHKIGLIKDVSE